MQWLMQTKFVPSDFAKRAYKECLKLCQGSRTISKYTSDSLNSTVCHYVSSLWRPRASRSPDIFMASVLLFFDVFNYITVDSLDRATNYAMKVEETLKIMQENK